MFLVIYTLPVFVVLNLLCGSVHFITPVGWEKIVQNGQTEPKQNAWGNPKSYVDTTRGEVCSEFNGTYKKKYANSFAYFLIN